MKIEALELFIKRHAYRRYRRRVGKVGLKQLYQEIRESLEEHDFYQKSEWLQIGSVWWICEVTESHLRLVTCYGRHDYDLPKALKWARHHNDRIRLIGGEEA